MFRDRFPALNIVTSPLVTPKNLFNEPQIFLIFVKITRREMPRDESTDFLPPVILPSSPPFVHDNCTERNAAGNERVSENRFSRRISSFDHNHGRILYSYNLIARLDLWNRETSVGQPGLKKKIIVAIFLIPGSSIIRFVVKEEGKEEIVDCLVDNWLISWERFLRRAAILAAKTATCQDNPAKGQAAPGSWKSHDLRLFADSTPIPMFYCRPWMDISSANVLGNLERAETDISDGRLRFQRLVFSSQETAGCRQIFDDRSIHGSLLVGLAFQARNYGIETTFFYFVREGGNRRES